MPCRIDDVSAASCYYQPAVFHHLSGGHKTRLGLIGPFENMGPPFRSKGNVLLTNAIIQKYKLEQDLDKEETTNQQNSKCNGQYIKILVDKALDSGPKLKDKPSHQKKSCRS